MEVDIRDIASIPSIYLLGKKALKWSKNSNIKWGDGLVRSVEKLTAYQRTLKTPAMKTALPTNPNIMKTKKTNKNVNLQSNT